MSPSNTHNLIKGKEDETPGSCAAGGNLLPVGVLAVNPAKQGGNSCLSVLHLSSHPLGEGLHQALLLLQL